MPKHPKKKPPVKRKAPKLKPLSSEHVGGLLFAILVYRLMNGRRIDANTMKHFHGKLVEDPLFYKRLYSVDQEYRRVHEVVRHILSS